MKVFTVYTTDLWESRISEDAVGIFSTVEKARDCVLSIIEEGTKVAIEEMIIDEVDSGAKLEVYSFDEHIELEWKSEFSNAQYGQLKREAA